MTKRVPSVAVIGTGYWGINLVRNFDSLGALKLVCDKNEETLIRIADQYPGVKTCLSLNEVLGDPEIDALVVATPAETHFTVAREGLLAGKHICVEKPLTTDLKKAHELVEIARRKGLTLMVGHLLHYHPSFVRLKELVAEGFLGRINYIYSHRLNIGKIRREENIFWSFAPHDISMILALVNETPETVLSTGGSYLHERIADVTTTHLYFPSGTKAHIFVSWLHPFKEQKLVVVGDKRMAVFDDTLPWGQKLCVYSHEIRWENQVPLPDKAEPDYVVTPETEPLLNECSHFLECVGEGRRPLTDGEEGIRVLETLTAGQVSLDRGGQRVDLDLGRVREADPENGYFAHETAIIDDGVEVGEGAKIWHFSHILAGSRIGAGANIGQNVVIGPDVEVGRSCKIQNNVSLYKGVVLADEVFVGPSVVFTNVINPRAFIRRMDEIRPTPVGRGATLGANSTIVCGTRIGRYAFVGAGAVVTGDVADYQLVMGNPARPAGWMCRCGTRLSGDGPEMACSACRSRYRLASGKLLPVEGE